MTITVWRSSGGATSDVKPSGLNYATGHHWRGINFKVLGRFAESHTEMQEALALDPISAAINVDCAIALQLIGRRLPLAHVGNRFDFH